MIMYIRRYIDDNTTECWDDVPMIPIYVVCGFLGAGKSTLINEQLRLRQKMASTAVFAFEEGTTALQNLIMSFSINK